MKRLEVSLLGTHLLAVNKGHMMQEASLNPHSRSPKGLCKGHACASSTSLARAPCGMRCPHDCSPSLWPLCHPVQALGCWLREGIGPDEEGKRLSVLPAPADTEALISRAWLLSRSHPNHHPHINILKFPVLSFLAGLLLPLGPETRFMHY